jgi:predicted extracellular nuclease
MKFGIAATALVQILFAKAATACLPTTVFINEIHYDDASIDANEGFEIAGTAGINLDGYSVTFYRGSGTIISKTDLDGVLANDSGGFGFKAFLFETNGLQNGLMGLALADKSGNVVQFLSYEGVVSEATEGPATGMTSIDIGVSENGDTTETQSMQLITKSGEAPGTSYGDFIWTTGAESTMGTKNVGQITLCGSFAPSMSSVPSSSPTINTFISIQTIQGSGEASPLVARKVEVKAYVTVLVANGFFMQEEASSGASSAGIFVFTKDPPAVAKGDNVSVKGEVEEYYGQTQLTDVKVEVLDRDPKFFDPVEIILPLSSKEDFEMYEGMLVSIRAPDSSSIVVSEYYEFARYGQVVVCSAPDVQGRLFQFTANNPPDKAGYAAHLDLNDRSCVKIDDGISSQNPNPLNFGSVYRVNSMYPILRGGAVVAKLEGVLTYSFGAWIVTPQSVGDLEYNNDVNPREAGPPVYKDAEVTVVLSNLLNYWTTIGTSRDLRGADSQEEFDRQVAKTILALTSMNADILGVVELENVEGNVATLDLVSRLNDANSGRNYTAASDMANQDKTGTDRIKVDVVYDTLKMDYVGYATLTDDDVDPALLDQSSVNAIFASKSRVPVAVTLRAKDTGKFLTVVVNHYKSKGSGPSSGPDKDQDDGAANWNQLRTLTSKAVVEWLKTNP